MSSTPRRDFLARVATTAAAGAIATLPLTADAEPRAPAHAPGPFDDSWTARVRAARHRAVFDSPEVSDGLAVSQAALVRQGYMQALGAKPDELATVVVFRHAGVVLAFDDVLWQKYGIGEWKSIVDPATGKPAVRNPWSRPGAPLEPGESIEELRAAGAIFLACQLAMNKRAEQLAKKAGADVETVRAEVRAHLLPGVILQPTGVYATARAQEVGCVFQRST